jgi:hypothetical protein
MNKEANMVGPVASKKILLAHSNVGAQMHDWHERRRRSAVSLGYDLSLFSMTEYHPYTIFPYLDKKWRRRDRALMRLYDKLGEAIAGCDIFIHFNGALIHPEFLEQFHQLKIYHCADDPDASKVLSRPVAQHYDICAISNPACIDMYRQWGCRQVIFWPLGAFHFEDQPSAAVATEEPLRDIPLIFIGSKFGVTNVGLLGRYLGLYQKKRFMERLERECPQLVAYGGGWEKGRAADEVVPDLYRRSQLGINIHNSLGPINGRLYDLAAFGVCQICDNKSRLSLVFEEGKEIVGFDGFDQAIDLIRHLGAHPEEARRIGAAGRARFMRDYSMASIWRTFFSDVSRLSGEKCPDRL